MSNWTLSGDAQTGITFNSIKTSLELFQIYWYSFGINVFGTLTTFGIFLLMKLEFRFCFYFIFEDGNKIFYRIADCNLNKNCNSAEKPSHKHEHTQFSFGSFHFLPLLD